MEEMNDRPALEIYPWYLVGTTGVLWGCIWFAWWSILRGTAGAFVVVAGSIMHRNPWVALLLPVQVIVWLISAALVWYAIRRDRNPFPLFFALVLILPVTAMPCAYYVLGLARQMSEVEVRMSGASSVFLSFLNSPADDVMGIGLALWTAAVANRNYLKMKYPRTAPCRPRRVQLGWAAAFVLGTFAALLWGTMIGFMVLGAIGNSVLHAEYRESIRRAIDPDSTRIDVARPA